MNTKNLRILKKPEVRQKCGLGNTALHEKGNPNSRYYDPTFPAPVALGGRAVGYYEHEIDAWLASRPRVTPETRKVKAAALVQGKQRKRQEAEAA
jgi:prophage regulatory protein